MKYLLNTVETNVSDPDNIDYSPFGETLVDVEVTYEFPTYLEAWKARNRSHGGEIIEAATGLPGKPTSREAEVIRYTEEQESTERFLREVWWKKEEAALLGVNNYEDEPAPF
jgi:hypothetical protein